jgi:hemerythrin superfamily protein
MPAPASSNTTGNRTGIHTAQRAPRPRPLAGVFETLVQQHRQILDYLRRAGSSKAPAQRRELWAEARRRLLSHERAEEQIVYATLEGYDAGQALIEQHGDQAVELELAIADLNAMDCESDEWLGQLRDLMAMVDDHVRDEENDFFMRAQRLLGENAARELEDAFARAQREVLSTLA